MIRCSHVARVFAFPSPPDVGAIVQRQYRRSGHGLERAVSQRRNEGTGAQRRLVTDASGV